MISPQLVSETIMREDSDFEEDVNCQVVTLKTEGSSLGEAETIIKK